VLCVSVDSVRIGVCCCSLTFFRACRVVRGQIVEMVSSCYRRWSSLNTD